MAVIWKQALTVADVQEVGLPRGAEILTAREQGDQVCIWFRCDPRAEKLQRKIALCGTGHAAPDNGRYIGTAMLLGGTLVIHVFEQTELA